MLAVALSLASAVLYGTSDFLSGVQSRRRSYLLVGFVAQCVSGALGLTTCLAGGTRPTTAALLWGSIAAVGAGVGTLALMKGLGEGDMHVAGPVSAVLGAGIPVVLGAVRGERPGLLATTGILAALPAVWLVAGGGERPAGGRGLPPGVGPGLLAGLGFGLYFAALAVPGEAGGPWVIGVCQVLAIAVTGLAVVLGRPTGTLREALPAWSVGLTGFVASWCYVAATHAGLLTIAAVVTSLYPAGTVLLAVALLGERARRPQVVGLLLAGTAVAAIALG